MDVTLARADALLIVDVQRDFLPGGKLGVPDGDAVVPVLNRYIDTARKTGVPVFASRDWHPEKHCSFKPQGGPWPEHCVAGTAGARFADALRLPPDVVVIDKAIREEVDAYSAFSGTTLADQLRARGVKRLLVGGLATDYCVLNTVRDALREGFGVVLLEDAIRAVNADPEDGPRARREMESRGAVPARYEEIAA
ncbi:MAG: pyrazinamidase/nicotinamidase [Burkholderiales bacterium]|jgi:nicotinamidase/pyrazinamidase|nr:pyrazinamidase/nicotinamidase [Burkholderiales bacterium]